MPSRTITINQCDRCAREQDMSKYMDGYAWGQMNLVWTGDKGGKGPDGSAGGINLKGSAWLCMRCTDDFQLFMTPKQESPQ